MKLWRVCLTPLFCVFVDCFGDFVSFGLCKGGFWLSAIICFDRYAIIQRVFGWTALPGDAAIG